MAKLGASAGWSGNYVQELTADTTLSKSDSGKVFTTIYPEIFLDTAANRTKLQEKVSWMKAQGYIKEHTETESTSKNDIELASAGIDAL